MAVGVKNLSPRQPPWSAAATINHRAASNSEDWLAASVHPRAQTRRRCGPGPTGNQSTVAAVRGNATLSVPSKGRRLRHSSEPRSRHRLSRRTPKYQAVIPAGTPESIGPHSGPYALSFPRAAWERTSPAPWRAVGWGLPYLHVRAFRGTIGSHWRMAGWVCPTRMPWDSW